MCAYWSAQIGLNTFKKRVHTIGWGGKGGEPGKSGGKEVKRDQYTFLKELLKKFEKHYFKIFLQGPDVNNGCFPKPLSLTKSHSDFQFATGLSSPSKKNAHGLSLREDDG